MTRLSWLCCVSLAGMLAAPVLCAQDEEIKEPRRWELKVEVDKPQKFVFDGPFGTREVYWYVTYRVTHPFSNPDSKPISNMCLDIWISTDANYRVLFPLGEKQDPNVEGLEYETEKEMYGRFDDLLKETRWGEGTGKMLPRYEGVGACYHDGFHPSVHDAVEAKYGMKFQSCLDINATPLNPGETRHGLAIFADAPVEEGKLFTGAVDHLYVQSEERRTEETALGISMLQAYEKLFPEGRYIITVRKLIAAKDSQDKLIAEVEAVKNRYVERMKAIQSGYDVWIKETEMFGEAVMCFVAYDFKKGTELLDELYKNYPEGEHRLHIEKMRILAKQKLMAEARDYAEKIRAALTENKSIPPEADRIYVTLSGATDPVYGWRDKVYAQEKLLQFVFRRTGGEVDRDFDFLRLVERRWIEPVSRPIRKVVSDPIE